MSPAVRGLLESPPTAGERAPDAIAVRATPNRREASPLRAAPSANVPQPTDATGPMTAPACA